MLGRSHQESMGMMLVTVVGVMMVVEVTHQMGYFDRCSREGTKEAAEVTHQMGYFGWCGREGTKERCLLLCMQCAFSLCSGLHLLNFFAVLFWM